MMGIIVQLLISWLLLDWLEKRHLSVLGYQPNAIRLQYFFLFLLLTSAFCASGFLLKQWLSITPYLFQYNASITSSLVWSGIWWNIKSVLFEELIFRGALLYILIQRIGAAKAIFLSAIGFGIYHWFSLGVWGNAGQMLVVFVITGCMGLVLAYAFYKTASLYVPIAIHFGWNFTQNFVFSSGPIGRGLFFTNNDMSFRTHSYGLFALVMFMPLLLALMGNAWLLYRLKKLPLN